MRTPYCYLPGHQVSPLRNGSVFPHSLQETMKTPPAFTIHCRSHLWFLPGSLSPYITSRWTQTCPFQSRRLHLDTSAHMPWMFHWPPLAPEDQQPVGRCHQLTCRRTPAPHRTRDSVSINQNEQFFFYKRKEFSRDMPLINNTYILPESEWCCPCLFSNTVIHRRASWCYLWPSAKYRRFYKGDQMPLR